MTEVLLVFAAQFACVTLFGIQQLNVMGDHKLAAAASSLLIGLLSYHLTATIAMAASEGVFSAAWFGYVAAGPFAIAFSMTIHPRVKKWRRRKVDHPSL
jgi:hypothetical protein